MSKKDDKAIADLDEYISFMKNKAVQPESITISELQNDALRKRFDGEVTQYRGYKVKIYAGDLA